jgi:hypothetical protein
VTVPHISVDGRPRAEQWSVTFRDFFGLVQGEASRHAIEPLLRTWFGYQVNAVGAEIGIVDEKGEVVHPLQVHLAIQDDPAKRYTLFQVAMSLWR